MKKDISTTVAYWAAPSDGTPPNPKLDAELFLGHAEEDNCPRIIHDIRGDEALYTLDENGFMAYTLPVKERCSNYPDTKESEYFSEISSVIKDLTGAKHAIPFLPVLRQSTRNAQSARRSDGSRFTGPSPRPHVDFSAATARPWTISKVPGAAALIESAMRWQVLGVWRPMKPIQRDPLVVSDSATFDEADFFDLSRRNTLPGVDWEVTILSRGNNVEGKGGHRWMWWSDMQPNEVLIFKHFDSERGKKGEAKVWRCAHTSVEIPGTEELPARESYEVRVLVSY